jgi:hypothetical protein
MKIIHIPRIQLNKPIISIDLLKTHVKTINKVSSTKYDWFVYVTTWEITQLSGLVGLS